MTSFPQCPDCGGKVTPIGPIAATVTFAGRVMERPLSGGMLYRCGECALGFRWPRPSKEKLDTLYAQGDELNWTAPVQSRQDWCIARGWIQQRLPAGSRILDVGCFDGGFLQPLVGSYRCTGIEIHPAARNRAEEKGIEVIGNDFSKISGTFDCITAFDVIEHIERPKAFLGDCLAALRPEGWILISTGNLDALTFRLMGSRYWYCTIAEHISFVSPKWFYGLADAFDYRVVRQATFSHKNVSWSRRIGETGKNVFYRFGRSGFRALRVLGMGGVNARVHPELADHPPYWISACDHFIVFAQKR